jgi:hypothetical protein
MKDRHSFLLCFHGRAAQVFHRAHELDVTFNPVPQRLDM